MEVMMEVVSGDNWTTGAISRAKLQSNQHHQQTNIQLLLHTALCENVDWVYTHASVASQTDFQVHIRRAVMSTAGSATFTKVGLVGAWSFLHFPVTVCCLATPDYG